MALIRLKQPLLSQPRGGAQINVDSPLAKGLCFLFSAGSGPVDLVSMTRASVINAARTVGKYGLSYKAASGKPIVFTKPKTVSTSNGIGTGDFTIASLSNPVSSTKQMCLIALDSGGGSSEVSLTANSNASFSTSAGYLLFDITGIGAEGGVDIDASNCVDGGYHLFCLTRKGQRHELSRDGIVVASTDSAARTVNTNSGVGIGTYWAYSGFDSTADNVLAAMWNRALSAEELKSLSANPWLLFEPEETWLWTPDGSSGPPASRRRVVMWG